MLKRLLSLMLALTVVIGISTVTFAAISTNEVAVSEKVKITFVQNTKLEAFQDFIENNGISMDSFMVTAIFNGKTCTSGYVINDQDNFKVLWADFISMQTALLKEGIQGDCSLESKSDIALTLQAINERNISINSIVCENPNTLSRRKLISSDIVESIEIITNQVDSTDEAQAIQPLKSTATNWLPTSGSAGAWPSQNVSDATYLEAHYQWSSASALSTLTGRADSTLEADLVLYNYDDTALATGWYSGSGNYTYNTNQPRPYQDTQAFDNGDEPVFCIGCSDASALTANTDYYWIAYGNRTTSASCKAKLNFQRGHRVIDSIYEETWNIFGDETTTVIPFSSWNTAVDPSKSF